MHYTRVPRAYWKDRLRRLRALGLNAVQTSHPSPRAINMHNFLPVALLFPSSGRLHPALIPDPPCSYVFWAQHQPIGPDSATFEGHPHHP